MSDEQQLNSVERFRKQPGRLVLEEHSHCEVPAGCGGVVLRWRNPHAALPLLLHLYTPGEFTLFLNGATPRTGRVDVAPGRHVAALVLPNADLSAGLFLFAATHDPKRSPRAPASEVVERPQQVLSAGDGTWKFSLDTPPDEWTSLPFDDHAWPALAAVPTPQLDSRAAGAYRCRRCAELGAACLAVPPAQPPRPARGTVWVRKVFEVTPPEETGPSPAP